MVGVPSLVKAAIPNKAIKIVHYDWFSLQTTSSLKRHWSHWDMRRVFEKQRQRAIKAKKEERNRILAERLVNPGSSCLVVWKTVS